MRAARGCEGLRGAARGCEGLRGGGAASQGRYIYTKFKAATYTSRPLRIHHKTPSETPIIGDKETGKQVPAGFLFFLRKWVRFFTDFSVTAAGFHFCL